MRALLAIAFASFLFLIEANENSTNFFQDLSDTSSRFTHDPSRQQPYVFSVMISDQSTVEALPHFLAYYISNNIPPSHFQILIHAAHPSQKQTTRQITHIFDAFGITHQSYQVVHWQWSMVRWMGYRVARQITAGVPDDSWVLDVDVDEFLELPKRLSDLLDELDQNDHLFVSTTFVDRVSLSGNMNHVQPSQSIFQQYPFECSITGNILNATVTKVTLHKAFVLVNGAHYNFADQQDLAAIEHFLKEKKLSTRLTKVFSKNHRQLTRFHLHTSLKLFHFKWVEGAIKILSDRAAFYRDREAEMTIKGNSAIATANANLAEKNEVFVNRCRYRQKQHKGCIRTHGKVGQKFCFLGNYYPLYHKGSFKVQIMNLTRKDLAHITDSTDEAPSNIPSQRKYK